MGFVVNRPILISMLFIGLSMLGYISYKNLPVELFPNAEEPEFNIQVVSVTEVTPAYMEQQAIIPLEGVAGTLEGVEEITSISTSNRGTITLSYNKNTNIKFAYLKLLEKVEQVRSTLPPEFNVSVVKSNVQLEMLNSLFMSLQVRGSGGTDRIRDITEREIKPELENIDGIASALVFGGREKTIEVVLDPELSEAYGITPNRIRNLLSQNSSDKAFVGRVYEGKAQQFVHVTAEYSNIGDIQSIVVDPAGPVVLGDVAEVYFGVKEETSLSRVNGKEAISLQLLRDSQVNMIDLSHTTLEIIAQLNKKLAAQDVELVVGLNLAEMMEDNLNQILELAVIGGILAIFVLWIFLRNLRLVIAIGVSIPISVFTAFNLFYAFNISVNSLTLVGMALAIGMLVDNSVVVLENIYRNAALGKSRRDAVVHGVYEVRRSVFAATLTTVTIFIPFLFSSDVFVKLIGSHIGISIVSTLLVSLFVSLLLIPMLTYLFMGSKSPEAFRNVSIHNKLIRGYIVLLKSSFRRPGKTVLTATGVFFVTLFLIVFISFASSSEVETADINVSVTMEGGSTLESTDRLVAEVEEKLLEIEEMEDVIANINEEDATLQVRLKDDYSDISEKTVGEIRSEIFEKTREIENATFEVSSGAQAGTMGGGGGGGGPSSRRGASGFQSFLGIGPQQQTLLIKGQDFEQMRRVAEDLEYYLDGLNSVQNVSMSINDNRPEVHIAFDQRLMSQYGLTLAEVTNELSGFQSEFSSGVAFKYGLEEYDITIKTPEPEDENERSMTDLREMEIESSSGSMHELQDLGETYYATGLWGISRLNQEKEIEVSYSFYTEYNENKDLLTGAKQEVNDMIASLTLPSGVAVEVLETDNSLQEYKFLMLAAVVLIFMILASIFESAITPFVLMFSIPLATVGSFLALVFTGNSIQNPNALTGMLILIGVVVNNSIILIDYSNILRKNGYSRVRALITAGIARVRPILITAITTIIAMFPLAMGQMEYVELIGAPFAITVIGGLALSTILTLVFIPTLSLGLENSIKWIKSLPTYVQFIMAAVFISGTWAVIDGIDSTLWIALLVFILIIGIPALTAFVLKSLVQAKEEVIPRDVEIKIRIQNLVKIYNWPTKMVRDFRGGESRSEKVGETKEYNRLSDFWSLLWQLPITVFLYYFTFIHLGDGLWQFLFGIVTYGVTLSFLRILGKLILMWMSSTFLIRVGRLCYDIIYWGMPLAVLIFLYMAWNSISLPIFFGIIWYVGITIQRAANRLKGSDVNPEAMKRRFSRFFYGLVYKIPVIGKKREPFKALKGVTLEIEKGMFGLLGPNGAGKTTLMRTICGIFEQSYGKIWFNELDSKKYREELQGLIGYLPQEFGMYENMSPHEYLNYQAMLKGILAKKERDERVKSVLESVNMYESRFDKIGSFSGGMKQRIGIAQILLHLPRILVVDEPTAGLDPRERIRFRNLLVELSRERIVIFSTHIIEDIASSCKNVAVLNQGELKYVGTPADMVRIAEDRVWQFKVSHKEFEALSPNMKIIHHMMDGDQVRVRCLGVESPYPGAEKVRPVLEDSYLWLMKDTGKVMSKLNE